MVIYFGKKFINKGKSEGELGIDSANKAYGQIQKIDPAIRVGLCPCLGRNGSSGEVFTLDDAKILKTFADKTPWVCSLHYWSINDDAARPRKRRDSGDSVNTNNPPAVTEAPRKPWAFADIFKSSTSAPSGFVSSTPVRALTKSPSPGPSIGPSVSSCFASAAIK